MLTEREEFEKWAIQHYDLSLCEDDYEGKPTYYHDETEHAYSGWQAARAESAKLTHQPDEEAYKAAIDFMYDDIGRDFWSLEPLEAAKAWMNTVLSKSPPSTDHAVEGEAASEYNKGFDDGVRWIKMDIVSQIDSPEMREEVATALSSLVDNTEATDQEHANYLTDLAHFAINAIKKRVSNQVEGGE